MIDDEILVIIGPTGVGKTKVSLDIAAEIHAEIINADSRQIYRYMDIGTGKPTTAERGHIPHHLFDIIDPDQHYNAMLFQGDADRVIAQRRNQTRLIVVGGTFLYIKALLKGFFQTTLPIPIEIRKRIERELSVAERNYAHCWLNRLDPQSAKMLHPNDLVRIIRAIEIYYATGIPASVHRARHGFLARRYRAKKIVLQIPRDDLYKAIEQRVDRMIATGLIEEVKVLLDRGYHPELASLRTIGYAQIVAMLQGKLGYSQAVENIKTKTKRYAKMQLTWLKAEAEGFCFDPRTERDKIFAEVRKFLDDRTS